MLLQVNLHFKVTEFNSKTLKKNISLGWDIVKNTL